MKSTKFLILMLVCFLGYSSYAQEWDPQLNVTGYVNTIAEFTDQKDHVDINKNIGIGLAEVGFLTSFRPVENLEFKGTFVYKHDVPDIQSMLVEAYGMYTVNQHFKVGLGKFLTPLSPVNVYFYAPLNPSVVLPMVVSHHYLTPQSISGLQIAGSYGDDWKVSYNLTYGNYSTNGHIRGGIINLMGAENLAQLAPADRNERAEYDLGGSARLALDYRGIFTVGANYFDGTRATLSYVDAFNPDYTTFDSRKWSAGGDIHLNLDEKLKINAEYWVGRNKTTDLVNELGAQEEVEVEYMGYYAEIMYTVGKFTPYFRYEYVEDLKGIVYAGDPQTPDPTEGAGTPLGPWGSLIGIGEGNIGSFGAGIAYRPAYELLLKMDYRALDLQPNAFAESSLGLTQENFNHLIFSAVISF